MAVQKGQYSFTRHGATSATLKLVQPKHGVESTLHLHFDHPSGGTLTGDIFEDGELVAAQTGAFSVTAAPPRERV